MMGVVLSMISSLSVLNYFEVLVILSFLTPTVMVNMYKTSAYLEDMMFCVNDINMLLNFMTVSLVLLIMLSTGLLMNKYYTFLQVSLGILLVLCFSSSNLLLFYILFESSLLPILLLIVGWGYQPERLQAGLYMILYTVFGSMPLLVMVLYIYWFIGSLSFYCLSIFLTCAPSFMYLGFLAFLVKLPVYSMHVWLPKAHVEAPLGGSMILAGALLKLGGYGMYMFNLLLVSSNTEVLVIGIICLSMWGGLFASVVCLVQSDIKSMIAYSSIVHMSLVVMGLLSNTSWGLISALITMVAHGWVSSALFLIAYITYQSVGSRSFNYTKGVLMVYPFLSLMWFILAMINMSVPPTINLVGELVAVPVGMMLNVHLLVILMLTMFMSVSYNMYMYTKINHGSFNKHTLSGKGITNLGVLSVCSHFMPLIMILSMDLTCLYVEAYM